VSLCLQVSTARNVIAAADVPGAAAQLKDQFVPAVEQVSLSAFLTIACQA
jgi:hypothetical protein